MFTTGVVVLFGDRCYTLSKGILPHSLLPGMDESAFQEIDQYVEEEPQ